MILVMVVYELKKIFCKKRNHIIFIAMFLLVIWSCGFTLRCVEWIDADGNTEVGVEAAKKLRTAQSEWVGILDETLLQDALKEIKKLDAMPEYLSSNYTDNRIAQGQRQGIQEIRNLLNLSFAKNFLDYDDRVAHGVDSNDLSLFYTNRVLMLENWLLDNSGSSDSGFYLYSDNEKQFLVKQYSTLDTPFRIDYFQGWLQILSNSGIVMQMGIILLGLLLPGIFADEFRWNADSVYYSSVYGRGKAAKAKLIAGFLTTTIFYMLSIGGYSLVILCGLGFKGGTCPIQICINYWKSMYNLSFVQAYWLTLVMGLIGYYFIGFLVIFVSIKTKSHPLAAMLPPLIILLPNFLQMLLSNILDDSISKIMCLLPHQMLNGGVVLGRLELYSIGKIVVPAAVALLILYFLLSILVVSWCYCENKNKQIF